MACMLQRAVPVDHVPCDAAAHDRRSTSASRRRRSRAAWACSGSTRTSSGVKRASWGTARGAHALRAAAAQDALVVGRCTAGIGRAAHDVPYGRSIQKALDQFGIDRHDVGSWAQLADNRVALRDAIHGGLLAEAGGQRRDRAATNRLIADSLAKTRARARAKRASSPQPSPHWRATATLSTRACASAPRSLTSRTSTLRSDALSRPVEREHVCDR